MKRTTKKSILSFILATVLLFSFATVVTAVDVPKYVVGEFVITTAHDLESETLQNELLKLPAHKIKDYFTSTNGNGEKETIFLLALEDSSNHAEAYKALENAEEGTWRYQLNYIYEPALDVSEKATYHKGDVDKDGEINATDYLIIKNAFLGNIALNVLADVDNDGAITSTDYLNVKAHFLGEQLIDKYGSYDGKPLSLYDAVLTDELAEQIKTDFIKTVYNPDLYTTEDVILENVMGDFDGAYIMMASTKDMAFIDAETTETVAGVEFKYKDGQKLTLWKDGEFYSLSEAYEAQLVSESDIIIANKLFINKNV